MKRNFADRVEEGRDRCDCRGLGHLGCQFAKAFGLMVVGKLTREMKDWHRQEIVERML